MSESRYMDIHPLGEKRRETILAKKLETYHGSWYQAAEQDGTEAARSGEPIEANPYIDFISHDLWLDGFEVERMKMNAESWGNRPVQL